MSHPLNTKILISAGLLFKTALEAGLYFELEMICWVKAVEKWKNIHHGGKLFLNCRPELVGNDRFRENSLAKKTGLIPASTVLELTRDGVMGDPDIFVEKIRHFADLGFLMAIDNVDGSLSDLETLVRFHPRFIKIDMSLIRDIHQDAKKQNLVKSIVDFCQKSGMTSIAEGIETLDEFNKVKAMGVDAGQGFFLAKPTSEIDLMRLQEDLHRRI